MFIHSLLVSPFVLDHMTVFCAELMKGMALMTHRDHHTLSIENGSSGGFRSCLYIRGFIVCGPCRA